MNRDIEIVRALAARYAELAAKPEQKEKMQAWAAHHALKPTRPLILATYGMWNVWCKDVFGDAAMECLDPFYRGYERRFKMLIFQDEVADDSFLEPWISLRASVKGPGNQLWGLKEEFSQSSEKGGAKGFLPPITDWSQATLTATAHEVDEDQTQRNLEKLSVAVEGILPIDVSRSPVYAGFTADLSTQLIRLRGLNEVMLDMYENPEALHRALAFMRDGVLANHAAAEKAGHYTRTSGANQQPSYAEGLPAPYPNSGPVKRKTLWSYCAAQEYTLVSPEFHEAFMFQYQLPIQEQFGLVHYGCCEDLTRKIGMLRKLKNLRSIAVAPAADVRACAEQIGTDYVASWRPNPTDMVCAGWDEARIRRIVREAAGAFKGGFMHVHLKDVETVQGDPSRLPRWVRVVREALDRK